MWQTLTDALQRRYLIWIVATVVCVLSLYGLLASLSVQQEQSSQPQYLKEAQVWGDVEGTAYVFLGLSAMAHQMQCPAAIESLVRYGGWGGHVYLITEQGKCYDEKKIIQDSGIKPEHLHITLLDMNLDRGVDVINLSKLGFQGNRVKSKSMKAQLFDVVTDPSIHTLVYVDCDVLFTTPGCARDLAGKDLTWERSIHFSKVYLHEQQGVGQGVGQGGVIGMGNKGGMELQGQGKGQTQAPGVAGRMRNLHTGVVVMHRQHSKEALRRWFEQMKEGVNDLDGLGYLTAYTTLQKEIDRSWANGGNGNGTAPTSAPLAANVMLPGVRSSLHPLGGDGRYERFVDPVLHMTAQQGSEDLNCILHMSKVRCGHHGRERIQGVVNRFRLNTFAPQHYRYCPNRLLEPLLYGWVPFSLLPGCPKIEAFF